MLNQNLKLEKYIHHYTFHSNPTQLSIEQRATEVPILLQEKLNKL